MVRRSKTAPLTIQVSFEVTRISPQCLIDAYTHLVPITRRRLWRSPHHEVGDAVEPTKRRADHA